MQPYTNDVMKVYYYHTVDIQTIYDGWRNGTYPGHFLYGATHLPEHGIDVILHKHVNTRHRWMLSLHTAWAILTCREPFDAVYATTFRGLEIIIFLHALGLFRRPVAVWHHQPVVKSKGRLREMIARIFYRGIDEMFFFSEKIVSASLLSCKARAERMHVAHWGADITYYDALSVDKKKKRDGFISTGREMRDMPTLVSAFNRCGAPLSIYVCREYGGTNYEDLFCKLATGGNISVNYISGLAHADMSRVVNSSACVVVCCKETNYTVGLTTVVEALALGLPLICSRNPQMPMDIDKEGCGITVDYGDVEGWVKAVEYIRDNPDEAEMMGKRGRMLAERLYNIERCAEDVAKVLKAMSIWHADNS